MFKNASFNWDVLYIFGVSLFVSFLLMIAVKFLWSKWDAKGYEHAKSHFIKSFYTLIVLQTVVIILFMVFNGYETHTPQEVMYSESKRVDEAKVVQPSAIEINISGKIRELKKLKEVEDQLKLEQEKSKRAYEESLNN